MARTGSRIRMTPELARTLSVAEQHEWFTQRRSRRTVLKGGVVGAGTLLGGQALLARPAEGALVHAMAPHLSFTPTFSTISGTTTGSSVSPFGRHISFGADPTSQMAVGWQVRNPVTSPFIRIGTSPTNLGQRITAELKVVSTAWADITDWVDSVPPALAAAKQPVEQYYLHALLDGLQAGQTYFYSVGHEGLDPAASRLGGLVASFTTAPQSAEPYTFTAFGDQGESYDSVATRTLILGQDPAFHLHAGDISYAESGGEGLLTDQYDTNVWDSFFATMESTASQVPWMFSLGNHEMEPWYSPNGYGADFSRMDFPTNGPSVSPGTYYFIYGNVAVISLDPNDVSYEIPANFGYTDGAQTTWLEQTLTSLRANSAVDFVVVFFHHCAFCTCTTHASDGGVRQFWVPLFDKFNVDLVINGHNHIYERTDPIQNGSPTTAAPIGSTVEPATQGTTYICCGGAGKSLYAFSAADSYEGNVDNITSVTSYIWEPKGVQQNETVHWSRVRYTGYNLIAVDVVPTSSSGNTTLTVRGLNDYGQEIDRVTLSRPTSKLSPA
jgi:hypothetical protein